jgi:hypothetical protein
LEVPFEREREERERGEYVGREKESEAYICPQPWSGRCKKLIAPSPPLSVSFRSKSRESRDVGDAQAEGNVMQRDVFIQLCVQADDLNFSKVNGK